MYGRSLTWRSLTSTRSCKRPFRVTSAIGWPVSTYCPWVTSSRFTYPVTGEQMLLLLFSPVFVPDRAVFAFSYRSRAASSSRALTILSSASRSARSSSLSAVFSSMRALSSGSPSCSERAETVARHAPCFTAVPSLIALSLNVIIPEPVATRVCSSPCGETICPDAFNTKAKGRSSTVSTVMPMDFCCASLTTISFSWSWWSSFSSPSAWL